MNNKPRFVRYGMKEQVSLFKRLSMILQSGTPLLSALHMLQSESSTRSVSFVLSSVVERVSQGKTLAQALEVHERVFGVFCISMVRIGESSGTLAEHLSYLADELKKRDALRKRVLGALVYPIIILVATIGISLVLTVYIFPKITPIFQGFKGELPLSTRILIGVSHFLSQYWIVLVFGIVTSIVVFLYALRVSRVRAVYEQIVLRVPLFTSLVRLYNLVLISRTLGLLLRSDVRLSQSLILVGEGIEHRRYRTALAVAEHGIQKGQTLSSQLQTDTLLFPALFVQMLRAGERSGDLSGSLLYVSDMYEDELNELIKNLTTLIEPVLMVLMGVTVGFIAISIITPIYSITQNLNHYK